MWLQISTINDKSNVEEQDYFLQLTEVAIFVFFSAKVIPPLTNE